ncbi:hypothetical protein M3O57_17985 [Xanthomonas nasturtii]|uniref:hypothetical protein n=1 Tax=Xanthomonas nasturtii TaxID=1843581 RepID=UPI0015F2738D|nr:hypothetical protein [Xanthomonas nasturtii]MCL1500569.1 hypothetical protein [Xanthomonas nasturtii]MCL1504856.1 hypothetical protein [Xanthomonas nasturtii]MCL1524138.1 hypothetical protein [Xanthomonas nasturtii]MCL1532265.1 hypothetical protein [Xanthomonas nasturtii]MCL1566978.1 hypothetical protein [Xanthomonas nasturtii]
MALDDPLGPLFAPWFEISVDRRQLSGLPVRRGQTSVRWSDDDRTLTCLARLKGSDAPPSGWMWSATHGWSAVAEASGRTWLDRCGNLSVVSPVRRCCRKADAQTQLRP